MFSPEDVTFLEEQGHVVRPANVRNWIDSRTRFSADPTRPQHPLRLDQPTLLYIPHGPRTLFEAILAANWDSPEQLSRVILFGNRLDLYDDPTYSGSLRDRRKDVDGTGDELGESAELIAQAGTLAFVNLPRYLRVIANHSPQPSSSASCRYPVQRSTSKPSTTSPYNM